MPTTLLKTIPAMLVRIFRVTTTAPSKIFVMHLPFAVRKLIVTTEGGVEDMSDWFIRFGNRTCVHEMNLNTCDFECFQFAA